MNPIIITLLCLSPWIISLPIVIHWLHVAPRGREDQSGFHYEEE